MVPDLLVKPGTLYLTQILANSKYNLCIFFYFQYYCSDVSGAYYQYLLSDPGLQSILSLAGCVSDPSRALVQRHIRIATTYFVNQDQREGTDNKHKSDIMVPDLVKPDSLYLTQILVSLKSNLCILISFSVLQLRCLRLPN